jgi:hypothetical protein
MTSIQLTIILLLAITACFVLVGGGIGLYFYTNQLIPYPPQIIVYPTNTPSPILPLPTRTLIPTSKPQPIFTVSQMPTNTPFVYRDDASIYLPTEDEMPLGYKLDPTTSGSITPVYPPYIETGLLSNYGRFYEDENKYLDPNYAWGIYFSAKVYDSNFHAQQEFSYWANHTILTDNKRLDKIKQLEIPGTDDNMWLTGISNGTLSIRTETRLIFRISNVTGMVILFGDINSADEMEWSLPFRMNEAGDYVSMIVKKVKQ